MNEFPLQFIHPELVVLLIPAMMLPRLRFRRGGVWFFTAVLCFGVLALVEPVLIRRVSPESLILYDLNRGDSPDAAMKEHPEARLVTFRGRPDATLMDSGARLRRGGGKIHLYGGVNDPDGAVERTAQLLNRRKIPVFVQVPPRRVPDRPELCRLAAPLVVGTGETAEIEAEVFFPDDRPAECILKNPDGGTVARATSPATPGVRRFRLRLTPERPGAYVYTLEVAGLREKIPLRVDPAFRTLVFTGRKTEAREIAALFDSSATVEVYDGTQDIRKYPLLVFGAGSVDGVAPETLEKTVRAAGHGAGVLFFAEKTPPFRPDRVPPGFARMLPLGYHAPTMERIPDVALVIIIDTSGSMSGGKLELAREVARLATDKLRDRDRCGILEFHGRRRWAAPLQSAADRLELHRALNRLSSGGGTLILPALREAHYALRNTDARLKHVLVITDGGVERGDFEGLIREMARYDVTISTVMVGTGDGEFLARLALWGNGRFYRAANRFAVPELSFRQSGRDRMPPWKEGVFAIGVKPNIALTAELPPKMSVTGTMESEALPGTQILLTAGEFPLLARRPTGVAVLNLAADGEWGKDVLRSPEFRAMLGALARSLPDPVRMRRYDFRDHSRRRRLHVVIDRDAMPERLYLRMTSPDGKTRCFVLKPEADGACHFRFADAVVGIHTLEIADDPGFGDADAVRIASRRAPLLLTENEEHAAAERINRRSRRLAPPTVRRTELSLRPVFGGLFIILLLGQLLWRRLPRNAASILLLALIPAMSPAGDYENALRQGLTENADRMAALQKAETLASTPADRKFARILLLEEARRQKRLPELLARFRREVTADPDLLELVVNELEDRGEAAEALRLLERHADAASPAVIRQMIRLAQKCGKKETDALRRRVHGQLRREPESARWFDAALHLELATGGRSAAAEFFRRTAGTALSRKFVSAAAETAARLMLYDEVEFALRRLETLSADDPWPCRLALVSLLYRRGEAERAVALLRKYAASPGLSPPIALTIADHAEQLGDADTALKLYSECGSDEASIRRAMLLDGCGRNDEASSAWMRLARNADNDMRSLQATDRLIALEKRRNRLLALYRSIAAMPERRSEARLQRLYLRTLAAAGKQEELFAELDKMSGAWKIRLDFLLEFKRWDEAMRLLSARISVHPDERDALLRQQAVIAIESGDAKAVEAAAAELLKAPAGRFAAAGFAAEVYLRVKQPERAAELYAECLQLAPDRHELHLLRANALAAAGRGEEALAFFRAQLTEDAPPEKFCVMVDGLLNRNAPPEVLRTALAQVMKRIENAPEQLLCYRLAEDLADELSDVELRRKLMLMQLAVAPERREMLLRELFEDARLRDDRQEAERFARLLVAWNGVYPPELRRELGRSLAGSEAGFAAAERSARNADDHAASTRNRFLFIDSCLDMMRPDDALRICRELVSLTPDDETALAKYALVLELCDDFRTAGEIRARQLELHAARRVSRNGKVAPPTPEEKRLVRAVAAHRVIFNAPPLPPKKKDAPGRILRLMMQHHEDALRRPPRNASSARSRRAAAPPSPEELAAFLACHNDDTGAKKLLELFDSTPKNRRAALFFRVLNALYVQPSPPVETALFRIMEQIDFPDGGSFGASHLPIAAAVKKRCAALVLKRHPESFSALVMAAEAHWLSGDVKASRLLAEEVFDRFIRPDAPKLPELRRLRELCMVYAAFPGEDEHAGTAARDTVLKALRRDRKLLGDTPGRKLLEAILLENAERHDAAFELLAAAWRGGDRTLAVFKMLEELTLRTGRFGEFSTLLETHAPKDQMTEVLYRRRLIQLLRDTGRHGEAMMQLAALPEALQRRERLRLLAAAPNRRYAWELRRFLLEEARDPRFSGYFYSDFGTGGIRGGKRRLSNLALPTETREIAATVEYLLLGTPVSDPAFSPLLRLRREIGGKRVLNFSPEVLRTPGGTALRAALGEGLSASDSELLRAICRSNTVPATTAEQLLRALPAAERPRVAEELAARMLAGTLMERDLEMLENVLRQCDDAGRDRLAKNAKHAAGVGDEYKFRLRFRATLRRVGIGEKRIDRDRFAPPGSDWTLVASVSPPERRLGDFFAATGKAPDWRDVLPLMDADTRKILPEAVEKATADAVRRRLMTNAEAVKSFSLLALADPERKAHWLALAARYDAVPGEASLWRLDALQGEAKRQLSESLRRAGRLPPARERNHDTPNNQHKE